MKIRTLALTGAALLALSAMPSYAHTSQPATPEEMAQTDALNAQALVNARGTPSADRSMANTDVNAQPAPVTDPNTAPAATDQAPADTAAPSSATVPEGSSGSMTPPAKPTPTLPEPANTPPKNDATNSQ